MHHQKCVGAFEPGQYGLYGLDERVRAAGTKACGGFFPKEFGDDFGVGLSIEGRSGFPQFFGDFRVVFDDAVMHEEKTAFAIAMRMGVFDGYAPVGGPTGMRDAVRIFGFGISAVRDFVRQCRNLSDGLERLHRVRRVPNGDACGIVPAVFEPFEPVEQDLVGVFAVPCVGEDSAHVPVGYRRFEDSFFLVGDFRCGWAIRPQRL